MKANELRIGNLVYTRNIDYSETAKKGWDLSEILQINIFGGGYCNLEKEIGKRYDNIESHCYFSEKCELKPIPLTEEWLLKFGFVITETNAGIECFYFGKRYSVLQPSNTNVWLLVDGEKGLCEIQFIHQLQNLYFALTNTELKCEKE